MSGEKEEITLETYKELFPFVKLFVTLIENIRQDSNFTKWPWMLPMMRLGVRVPVLLIATQRVRVQPRVGGHNNTNDD